VASLPGAVYNLAWAPSPHVAFLGNGEPGAPGWANVDLYVWHGTANRQLAAGRDLTIWNTTFGDFGDQEQFFMPALQWLDKENAVALVAQRGAAHPYSFRVDGSVEALADADVVCIAIAAGGGHVAVAAVGGGPLAGHAVEVGALR